MRKTAINCTLLVVMLVALVACGKIDSAQTEQYSDDWGIGSITIEEAGGRDYERGQEAIESEKRHQDELIKEQEEKENEPVLFEKIFSKVHITFVKFI